MPIVNIPGVGDVFLVDREQLRFKLHGRQASIPYHLKSLMSAIPPPPAVFDWSKNEAIKYPMLGNDQYGDCYYAAAAHMAQTWTGNTGTEYTFDVNALTKRYLKISGGDNGLSDSDIYPEWKNGIVGPNGPRKIFDEMTINPRDTATLGLCMWAFCGVLFTCALPSGWANNAKPGATWGVNAGKSVGGHAIILTGRNSKGGSDLRTWGISPPINVTDAGMQAADPELIVAASMDIFDANGVAPCGANYDQLAALWVMLGGKAWPANPFPPSAPLDWFA